MSAGWTERETNSSIWIQNKKCQDAASISVAIESARTRSEPFGVG